MTAASTIVNGRTTAPWAVVPVMMLVAFSPSVALAADADTRPPATFAPGDISIGEPIALPFAKPAPPGGAAPLGTEKMSPVAVGGLSSVTGPATEAASGWLGLTVAESTVPGRWSIVDVAAGGPAAGAGVRVGDELRAINGAALRNGDEVAQALTAISAGQTVRLSIARSDRVSEVPMAASPRPTAAATREWQPSTVAIGAVAPRVPDAVPLPTTSVLTEPRPTRDPPVALPDATALPTPQPTPLPAPTLAAPRPESSGSARGRTALGVRTMPIDPGIQARFRLPEATGAYVIGVVGDLPASKAGIPPGSVIVKLDERPVRTPQELTQLVTSGPVDRPVAVQYVLPGGTERRADVVLQALELPLEKALTEDPGLQPGPVPTLVPEPDRPAPDVRTSRRPLTRNDGETDELRREVGRLRAWLEVLERRLDRSGR